jgi:hypothetical protein
VRDDDRRAGVLLGGPFFLRFGDQGSVRTTAKELFQPSWSAAQPCAQIGMQLHWEGEFKLEFKPDCCLTHLDPFLRGFFLLFLFYGMEGNWYAKGYGVCWVGVGWVGGLTEFELNEK